MMTVKLLFDFGLFVLIWMTQLIVYPSFTQFDPVDLQKWHSSYTLRISILVMPLMVGQLVVHIHQLSRDYSLIPSVALVCILLAWVNTFLYAVPLHNQIASGVDISIAAEKLVSVNAWRTWCWSFVFFIDVFLLLKK
jgi:DMSO reductase anchor subunit